MWLIRYKGVSKEKEEKSHKPLLALLNAADSRTRVLTGKAGEISRTQRRDGKPGC